MAKYNVNGHEAPKYHKDEYEMLAKAGIALPGTFKQDIQEIPNGIQVRSEYVIDTDQGPTRIIKTEQKIREYSGATRIIKKNGRELVEGELESLPISATKIINGQAVTRWSGSVFEIGSVTAQAEYCLGREQTLEFLMGAV